MNARIFLLTDPAYSGSTLKRKDDAMSTKSVVVDNIIRVDRSIRPLYPDWVETVMHPEMESNGPAEYDISAVEQWLHKKQKNCEDVKGQEIYTHLKKSDTLKICLGLRDLEEIQKKGVAFFWRYFQGKCVFGLKGVVCRRGRGLRAPYLYNDGDKVVLSWHWLGFGWYDRDPALRFVS